MAFLELDGWQIHISEQGGQGRHLDIGQRNIAFDGRVTRSVRAFKREWEFRTNQIKRREIEALVGTVQARGDHWPGDDLYSSKGLPATSPVYTSRSNTAADGAPVFNGPQGVEAGDLPEAKYDKSIWVEPGVINILNADQRDAEGAVAGNYTGYGGITLSMDTSNYWQGSQSLKAVYDNTDPPTDGFYTNSVDPGAGSANTTYVGSVYLKAADANARIYLYLRDVTNGVNGPFVDVDLQSAGRQGIWFRAQCYITIGGTDCRDIRLYAEEAEPALDSTIYFDGFQIERRSYATASPLNFATSWVDGSRVSANSIVDNVSFLNGAGGITLATWFSPPPRGYTTASFLLGILDSGGSQNGSYLAVNNSGTQYVRVNVQNADGSQNTTYNLGAFMPWEWHHIAGVFIYNPLSGENQVSLYYDGSLVASAVSSIYLPDSSLLDRIRIGQWGAAEANTGVSEPMVLPWAATAEQVAGWYNAGRAKAAQPYLNASGDYDTSDNVEVMGAVNQVRYRSIVLDNVHQPSAGTVAFRLREK